MPSMQQRKAFAVTRDGQNASLYTLMSPSVEMDVTDYGASIVAIRCLDKYGRMDEVVAGFTDISGYEHKCQNDASDFQSRLHCHQTTANISHFDKVVFSAEATGNRSIKFDASVPRNDGLPGKVNLSIKYKLCGSEVHIRYSASSDSDSVVYLGRGTYFNLSGQNERRDLKSHLVTFHSDSYIKGNEKQASVVDNTPFDLRKPKFFTKDLITAMREVFDGGTWYCFPKNDERKSVAKFEHLENGRTMMVDTTRSLVSVSTLDRCDAKLGEKGLPLESGTYYSLVPTSSTRSVHQNSERRKSRYCDHTCLDEVVDYIDVCYANQTVRQDG